MNAGIEPTMMPRMLMRRHAASVRGASLDDADDPPRAGRYLTFQ